jgi:carboxypeptidase C (cathepsin A)
VPPPQISLEETLNQRSPKRLALLSACALFAVLPACAQAAADDPASQAKPDAAARESVFKPAEKTTQGSVTVGGQKIDYQAVAGTLVVHPKGWDDVPKKGDDAAGKDDADDERGPSAEASMFYVAYVAKGAPAENRPVTFLFNGGPGSSSVWLHMGAFGPRRVVTLDDSHTPAAPYKLVNNEESLLDASDLVFVDAPGTGFSRIAGKDKDHAFYGVDQDAHAFAEFITRFLSKYNRWNSPKFLFGESYGTTRAAVLANLLQADYSLDLNGVILLSQILCFDASADEPEFNPAVDLPYVLALPTYAATAWYHKKLPGAPRDLPGLLQEVQHFAVTDYALALGQGAALDPRQFDAIVSKLHDYTGLPAAYIAKANLRIDGGEFEKTLQDDAGMTTGRLDTRFSGPTLDPLSKEAEYDPQSSAISSAYVSTFNTYARTVLQYGEGQAYKPEMDAGGKWDFTHQPPGAGGKLQQTANVMPDLATAMKTDPNLHVLLNGGYYDLATPYFEGIYEMRHLQIPQSLQANIEYKQYQSGHMVYAHEAALKDLHDTTASFIRRSSAHGS